MKGRESLKTKSKFQKIKRSEKPRRVFGWSKSNKCERKNTGGLWSPPTVVPQQIVKPRRCVQHRDCWCPSVRLHHQSPAGVSVEVLVALLRG